MILTLNGTQSTKIFRTIKTFQSEFWKRMQTTDYIQHRQTKFGHGQSFLEKNKNRDQKSFC